MSDDVDRIAEEIAADFHAHECKYYKAGEDSEACEDGCVCECGAHLEMGPTFAADGLWAWHLPDGSWAVFPDPALKGE
jgi:hypothetical protein